MTTAPNRYADRRSAGRELAVAIRGLHLHHGTLVLGLPRGGVPVAYEVALALHAALDVIVVRKIGLPSQPELAIGAIAPGDVIVREPHDARLPPISSAAFARLVERERFELRRRERAYRQGREPLVLDGRTAILVDDGIATGATMRAAVRFARSARASRVIVAAPVAATEAADALRGEADQLVILQILPMFFSVGEWYESFPQTSDQEVQQLLLQAALRAQDVPPQAHHCQ